ncbi:hypothetical protein P175DRAFT_0559834 [Aspergillus ochraceoroseus IBT 24754]|uniref:Zn(2)-C6 fungal-type domain-containing protein n=2 Tax=Aspergillus ochraceoroseus TaxID=138278 RepID=A0A2T5LRV7_9EURO|nr:uncharacterized protein P175DRAFT_0559834 [Aspergillus ochraceoroseus IBT 24754]KKK11851.1 hypothetical protein AOCH_001011 [Aspergillus ochraceoroseus]PTU19017.1 hypothetical protein P175DRAFT_0559834 [Aspergillus ochraceoroseus IBT 24754]
MLAQQNESTLRRGTKSCTECRRRKVRCVRIPEDAPTCRQCTERKTDCLAQTSSVSRRQRQTHRLPSRYRISQLESQVSRLTKIVTNIEAKLGGKLSLGLDSTPSQGPGSDDSDGESSASEILNAEGPSHLRSLFQNDWLSVDTRRHDEQLQERRVKASAHLLEIARPALQKLIPSKEDTSDMTVYNYDWLNMLHMMIPQPFAAKSQQEMLKHYEEMCQPDVDVISLASWLLTVAITAQQFPRSSGNIESPPLSSQKRLDFSRAVSDTVENLILTHDRLVGTVQGLGMAIHFIRLQMGRGNFQQAWIKLRHVIAIAELMGLPKTSQQFPTRKNNGSEDDRPLSHKLQLWELICNIDRLLGMVINLPPGTRRYRIGKSPPLMVNGVVQPRVYVSRLMDAAFKIHDLEDLNAVQGPTPKIYTSALEITREVRELASHTPKSWWAIGGELQPDHIVQLLHYCVIMRAHLPLALRQDQSEEYLYSRLACMDACESVAQRYQFVRQRLPPGLFTSRLLDLQAFTATVVLLLTSNACPSVDRRSFQIDKARLEGIVSEVIKLMSERSKDTCGSDFAERGVHTLCALKELLQQDESAAHVQELTLNVPLLGKVHICRNPLTSRLPRPHNQSSSEVLSHPYARNPGDQVVPAIRDDPSLLIQNDPPGDATQPSSFFQWDQLSWFIEDTNENLLDDATMTETLDQGVMWQNAFYNTPFS